MNIPFSCTWPELRQCFKLLQEHYIQQQRKIGGIILVSAFDTPLVAWSELNKILQAVRLDLKNLPYSYKRAVMLISSNDPMCLHRFPCV